MGGLFSTVGFRSVQCLVVLELFAFQKVVGVLLVISMLHQILCSSLRCPGDGRVLIPHAFVRGFNTWDEGPGAVIRKILRDSFSVCTSQ